MNFLNYDSPLGKLGTMIFDLIWLQILVVLTSVPLFTVGASFTAMHTVLLKLYRDEHRSVSKDYFKAFTANFRQGSMIWLLYLAVIFLLITDYQLASQIPDIWLRTVLQLLPIPVILLCVTLTWVFVLLSRYHNTVIQTFKNAFWLCVSRPFTTLGMLAISAVPVLLLLYVPNLFLIVLFMGITSAGYMCTILYSRIFDQLEQAEWCKDAEALPDESAQE